MEQVDAGAGRQTGLLLVSPNEIVSSQMLDVGGYDPPKGLGEDGQGRLFPLEPINRKNRVSKILIEAIAGQLAL